jgi:MFS family permease
VTGKITDKNQSPESLMSRIKLELVTFLGTIAIAVRAITQQQLLQDKLCMQKFHAPIAYCRDLQDEPDSELKDLILANFSAYMMVKEVIILIPHVLTVLYIGSWCDRFANGRRYCMIAGVVSLGIEFILMALNSIYYYELSYMTLLFSYLPSSLFGSNFGLQMVIWSYITAYTRQEDRAYRLVFISVIMALGQAVGVFAGGLVIKTTPLFFRDQLRNYAGVFLISGICVSLMLILVICFMQEQPDKMIRCDSHNVRRRSSRSRREDGNDKVSETTGAAAAEAEENESEKRPLLLSSSSSSSPSRSSDVSAGGASSSNNRSTGRKNNNNRSSITSPASQYATKATLGNILSLSNLTDIMQSLTATRDGNDRKILLLLLFSFIPLTLPMFGSPSVAYPIVQKLYQWNNFDFSNVTTIGSIIHPLVTLVFMPLMFKIIKCSDLQVSIIGTVSYCIGNLFLGTFAHVSPIAYFVTLLLTSFSSLIAHGIRAHISNIVSHDEVSKFYSLIAMLEALLPFPGSLMMSSILQASISFYPALVFQFAGFLMIIGLAILVLVDLIRDK